MIRGFFKQLLAKPAAVKHAHYRSRDRCTDSESPWEGRVLMWACFTGARLCTRLQEQKLYDSSATRCLIFYPECTVKHTTRKTFDFFFAKTTITTTTTTVIINVSVDFCLQVGFEITLLLNYILQCTFG